MHLIQRCAYHVYGNVRKLVTPDCFLLVTCRCTLPYKQRNEIKPKLLTVLKIRDSKQACLAVVPFLNQRPTFNYSFLQIWCNKFKSSFCFSTPRKILNNIYRFILQKLSLVLKKKYRNHSITSHIWNAWKCEVVRSMFEVFGLVSNPSNQIVSVISFQRLLIKAEPINSDVEETLCIVLLYYITFLILQKSCFATCKYFVSLIRPKKREVKISRLRSALPRFIKWLSAPIFNI